MNTICKRCNEAFPFGAGRKYCNDCKYEARKESSKKQRERMREKRLERVANGDIKAIYEPVIRRYENSAKKRGLEFYITIDTFVNYHKSNCYYCGDIMDRARFDRYNNDIGYTELNIVPCCTWCNTMKNKYTAEQLIEKCKTIAKRFSVSPVGK